MDRQLIQSAHNDKIQLFKTSDGYSIYEFGIYSKSFTFYDEAMNSFNELVSQY